MQQRPRTLAEYSATERRSMDGRFATLSLFGHAYRTVIVNAVDKGDITVINTHTGHVLTHVNPWAVTPHEFKHAYKRPERTAA